MMSTERQEFEGKMSQTGYGLVEVFRKLADKVEANLNDGMPHPEALAPALEILNRWYEKKRQMVRDKASDIQDDLEEFWESIDPDGPGPEGDE